MRLQSIFLLSFVFLISNLCLTANGQTADQKSPSEKMILLPYPQQLKIAKGTISLDKGCTIEVPGDKALQPSEIEQLADLHRLLETYIQEKPDDAPITIRLIISDKGDWPDSNEAYRLSIRPDKIEVRGKTDAGLFYGMQTLIQIIESCGTILPCLDIVDWPDFQHRGYYMDVTRGRVPTLATMKMVADRMARLKMNQLQLYVEHTYDFQFNPNIGKGSSPLTANEIRELDKHCKLLRVELVPSLATFGHMGRVLSLPEYTHLAEVERGKTWEEMTWWNRMRGLTIDPVNPEARELITKMCDEFFPPFSAPLANVCGDETFDLGKGKNKDRAEKEGTGKMYVEFIQFLHSVCKKNNKRMMMWGDVIKNHKELLPDVPKDIIMLNWGYWANFNYDSTKLYTDAGFETYVCPGCSGWNRIMNGINNAEINIRSFAKAGVKYGAVGLLNTDWGDDGHVNFLACSWHPIYIGASVSWNCDGNQAEDYDRVFCYLLFGKRDTKAAEYLRAIGLMGDQLDYWKAFYTSIHDEGWQKRLSKSFNRDQYTDFARKAQEAAVLFEQYKKEKAGSTDDLDELIAACQMTSLAARKFAIEVTPENEWTDRDRQELKSIAADLGKESQYYQQTWMKRYKQSDINKVMKALEDIRKDLAQ